MDPEKHNKVGKIGFYFASSVAVFVCSSLWKDLWTMVLEYQYPDKDDSNPHDMRMMKNRIRRQWHVTLITTMMAVLIIYYLAKYVFSGQ
jgi:cytochrome c-type biogenesis protein CcmH/NrfG